MNLLQQLQNIPDDSILAECIIMAASTEPIVNITSNGKVIHRYNAEKVILDKVCEFIFKQGCDNDRMMREVVGNDLYQACIDYHCQHIEISIL